jgi:methylphosphotriester-DNA--protein-cysteine methyltransferase
MQRMPTFSSTSNGARWKAIQGRDRAVDGQFVYAVRSAEIYCRPSCPVTQDPVQAA